MGKFDEMASRESDQDLVSEAAFADNLAGEWSEKANAYRAEKARREAEAKKTVGQRVAEGIVTGKADCGDGRFGVMFDLGCGPYEWKVFSLSGATPRTAPDIRNAIAVAIDKVRADTIEECVVAVDQVNVCTSVGRNVLNTAITEIRRLVLK